LRSGLRQSRDQIRPLRLLDKTGICELDDQKKVEQFAGEKVIVTGTTDQSNGTIHLAKIANASENCEPTRVSSCRFSCQSVHIRWMAVRTSQPFSGVPPNVASLAGTVFVFPLRSDDHDAFSSITHWLARSGVMLAWGRCGLGLTPEPRWPGQYDSVLLSGPKLCSLNS
jgi:hypothetical protein